MVKPTTEVFNNVNGTQEVAGCLNSTQRKRIRPFALAGVVCAFFGYILMLSISTAHAGVLAVNEHDNYTEYLGVTGVRSERNAPFRIMVPHDWNGELLVWARGTGNGIMFEYQGSNLVPVLDPGSGLPIVGTTPMNNIPGAPLGDNTASLAFEQALLLQGYALAASNYKPDPQYDTYGLAGWIVEDGITDTIAITRFAKYLLSKTAYFPRRTILWARSQGSLVALNIIEQHERPHYDGLITACTVGAGGPRNWDRGLDIALAYDTAFSHLGGWNEAEWGPLEG